MPHTPRIPRIRKLRQHRDQAFLPVTTQSGRFCLTVRWPATTPNVHVRLHTEVVGGGGAGHLETLTLRTKDGAAAEVVPASALFLMIGAEPHTDWLRDGVARDQHGFILTGRHLVRAGALPTQWSLQRPPTVLETSIPGVFAAGDVRHGSVKRVASAVGEGANLRPTRPRVPQRGTRIA
jgi:thioredoxin reductase